MKRARVLLSAATLAMLAHALHLATPSPAFAQANSQAQAEAQAQAQIQAQTEARAQAQAWGAAQLQAAAQAQAAAQNQSQESIQNQTSVQGSGQAAGTNYSQAQNDVRIIPAAPDAVGGGNPLQGLGRNDENSPSRRSQFESVTGGTSAPIAGSTNPNVPPDLPSAPLDPIQLQREREEKEKQQLDAKKAEDSEREKEKLRNTPSAVVDTPLKKALLQINMHNYPESLIQLDDIIAAQPRNAEAHYLKAVVFVLTRKYDDAATEYQLVLKSDPTPALSSKARTGLMKLAR